MSATIVQSIRQPFLIGLRDKIGSIDEFKVVLNILSILSEFLVSLHYLILSEFNTTVTELTAIAAAATIGFNIPAMAIGITAPL
jgi:hypothetical protein